MEEQHRAPSPAEEGRSGEEKRRAWVRATLAGMEDGLVLCDATGRIVFFNAAAESLSGWKLEEVRDHALDARLQFVDPNTRKPIDPSPMDALRTGVSMALASPVLLLGKQSLERTTEGSFIPVRNDGGEITGLVVLFRDALRG